MAQSESVAVPSDKNQLHSWSPIRFVIGLRMCFWLTRSAWFYKNLHLSAPPGRAGFFTSIFHVTRLATARPIGSCPKMPHHLHRRRSTSLMRSSRKPMESQSLFREAPRTGVLALLMLLIFAEGYIGLD